MSWRAELDEVTRQLVQWLLTSGLRILFILIGALLLRRALNGLIKRIGHLSPAHVRGAASEHEKRMATIVSLLRTAITCGVLLLATSMVLREFGMTIGPLLASAGIVGLAVGFGAQNLVRDVVSGFFMLLENQYREGDVIRAAGVEGMVESFGLRATVLRDFEGHVHHVPNGEIKVVTNLTQDWSRAVIDVEVAYQSDLDHVVRVLERTGDELKGDPAWKGRVLEAHVLGLERLGESAVVVRTVLKTPPDERLDAARELRRRIVLAFAAEGIEIPFPQRTLHIRDWRQGKDEEATADLGEGSGGDARGRSAAARKHATSGARRHSDRHAP